MRRKDREITDQKTMKKMLDGHQVCRVGMQDDDGVYVVPMNFGYIWTGDLPEIYLHCANSGQKLTLLAQNPRVCVEWDGDHQLLPDEDPSECTYQYSSLIGQGTAEILSSMEDKTHALCVLCEQYGHQNPSFPQALVARTGVIKITLKNLTCKANMAK